MTVENPDPVKDPKKIVPDTPYTQKEIPIEPVVVADPIVEEEYFNPKGGPTWNNPEDGIRWS